MFEKNELATELDTSRSKMSSNPRQLLIVIGTVILFCTTL